MWGASTDAIRKARPKGEMAEAWVPIPIPICQNGQRQDANDTEWTPLPIPIRTVRAPQE